ncbi:tetratricopeptide repeat protein [Reinekea marinisedimentorum]|uniref:Uncharacterized protein HemY n=1 Tax=Reinekea marinisedimentorum TaxID=230495 RepID=A0A4R3I3B7_9GAMM|nr:tetratricopeptide repeat protein [Reinekea marinisedimentorum]TCS40304.1 uncharacterized protein HemY [Reinekea marinisedimentorum]
MNRIKIFAIPLLLSLVMIVGCSSESDQDKALAFVERSQAYERQGQYRAALIEMRNAIQASPNNQKFVNHYASLLTEVGSPNQASEMLKPFYENNADVNATYAEALLLQGKFISAKTVIDAWVPTDEEKDEHARLTALQMFLAGKSNEAFKIYRELSGNKDTSLKIKQEFISLLIQEEQYGEAESWNKQLQQQFPEDPVLMYYQAKLDYQKGKIDDAENALTNALKYLPETDMLLTERQQVLELLSTVLLDQGRPAEALIYSKLIREANPEAFLAQQQYKDALAAASQGDLDTAKANFEDILNQFPNNHQAAMLLGLIHIGEGDIESGELLLSENIDAETAPVSIIRATALAQAEQGKPDEALEVLKKALLARPDDTTLLSLFGIISLNSGEEQQGLQSISKALQLEPNRTRLHLLLAQYYLEQENESVALGHLRKAYAQNREDWATTGFYVSQLIRSNEQSEATQIRDELSKLEDPNAIWLVAMADYQLGNTEASITGLEELHKTVPQNLNTISALGRLYQAQNSFDEASDMWLKALKVNPGSEQYLSSLTRAKSATLDANKLTNWLIKEADNSPEVALPLHSAAVELLVGQRDINQAKNIASKYTNNEQPFARAIHANILRGEAFALAQQNKWKESLTKVEQAINLLPDHGGLAILGAQVEMQLDNYQGAVNKLDNYLEDHPENMVVTNEKVKFIAGGEGEEQALAFIKPIWQNKPDPQLATNYFRLIRSQEPENLEEALFELLNVAPNNTGALTALGSLYQDNGQTDMALEQYSKALEINPNLVVALNNMAWMLKEAKPKEALDYAEKAVNIAPNSASILDTYGWVLHLNGKKDEALDAINKALTIAPDNAEIQEHKKAIEG